MGKLSITIKSRRHHNNKGTVQIKRGKTHDQVKAMERRLKIPFGRARLIEDGDAPTVFHRFEYVDSPKKPTPLRKRKT